MQNGVDEPTFLLWLCGRRRLLPLCFFQSFRLLRAALAFSKFQLGRPLRGGKAQRVEHPVPSSPAKMPDESFVLFPRDRPNHLVGPTLDNNRVNTYMDEEAQDVSDKAV